MNRSANAMDVRLSKQMIVLGMVRVTLGCLWIMW